MNNIHSTTGSPQKSFMEKLYFSISIGVALALVPSTNPLFAQKDLDWLIKSILLPILRNVVVLIFALALIVFLWKMMNYLNGTKPGEALQGMGWSILTMFVMVAVWGLVKLLENTFQLEKGPPALPQF